MLRETVWACRAVCAFGDPQSRNYGEEHHGIRIIGTLDGIVLNALFSGRIRRGHTYPPYPGAKVSRPSR